MAARIRKIKHDDFTRTKIKVSQLINRLQYHIFNIPDPATGNPVKLDNTQIKAIEILLRKAMPDLSSVEGNMTMAVSHEDAVKEIEQLITVSPTETKAVLVN